MKKIFLGLALALAAALPAIPQTSYAREPLREDTPHARASQAMKQYFPSAEKVDWVKSGTTMIARFYVEGDFVQARFDAKGNLMYSYRNCSVEKLPAFILSRASRAYSGYAPVTAVEYSSNQGYSYLIWMKKEAGRHTKWIKVKVEPYGNLAVLERLQQKSPSAMHIPLDADSLASAGK